MSFLLRLSAGFLGTIPFRLYCLMVDDRWMIDLMKAVQRGVGCMAFRPCLVVIFPALLLFLSNLRDGGYRCAMVGGTP